MLSLFYYKKGVLHEKIKTDKTEVKRAWNIKKQIYKSGGPLFL